MPTGSESGFLLVSKPVTHSRALTTVGPIFLDSARVARRSESSARIRDRHDPAAGPLNRDWGRREAQPVAPPRRPLGACSAGGRAAATALSTVTVTPCHPAAVADRFQVQPVRPPRRRRELDRTVYRADRTVTVTVTVTVDRADDQRRLGPAAGLGGPIGPGQCGRSVRPGPAGPPGPRGHSGPAGGMPVL
eukprot:747783-Hanusia_phi.AAC.4